MAQKVDDFEVKLEVSPETRKSAIDKTVKEISSMFSRLVDSESMGKFRKMFNGGAKDITEFNKKLLELKKSLRNVAPQGQDTVFSKNMSIGITEIEKNVDKLSKSAKRAYNQMKELSLITRTMDKLAEGQKYSQMAQRASSKNGSKDMYRERARTAFQESLESFNQTRLKSTLNMFASEGGNFFVGADGKKNKAPIADLGNQFSSEKSKEILNSIQGKIANLRKASDNFEKESIKNNELILKAKTQINAKEKEYVLLKKQEADREKEIKRQEDLKRADLNKQIKLAQTQAEKDKVENVLVEKNKAEITEEQRLIALMEKKKSLEKDSTGLLNLQKDIRKEITGLDTRRESILKRLNSSEKLSLKDTESLKKELSYIEKTKSRLTRIDLDIAKSIHTQNLDLEKQKNAHNNILIKLKEALKNAFTLEKIFNRMAFVITAKIAYQAFDFINQSLRQGFDNAIKLEAQLKRIYSISRGQDQSGIRKSSLDSIKLGLGVDDVSNSAYQAISAQFTTAEASRLMEISAKSAVAGFTTQTDAMDALTTVIRAYNLSVDDATRVSDILFRTIELGKTELKDLAPDIGKISATASLLGISFEEVSAGLATMTLNGIKTNVAITSMNQLLLNMTKPTAEAKAILDKYGISLDIAEVKVKGLAGVVKELNVLTDEEIATIASSNRGFRALATAIQSNTEWQENYNKIVNSTGATQKAFNDQMETTQMKLNRLKGAFIEAGIVLGDLAKTGMNFVDATLTPMLKGLNTWTVSLIALPPLIYSVTKAINLLGKIASANPVLFGVGLVATSALYVIGSIKKSEEDLAKFQKDRAEERINELSKERGELEKQRELLKTYQTYKEKEANNEKLSKQEKSLLLTVQNQLTKEYGLSNEKLKDYNLLLQENTKKQNENFETIRQNKLNEIKFESITARERIKSSGGILSKFNNLQYSPQAQASFNDFYSAINKENLFSETFSDNTRLSKIKQIREEYNRKLSSLSELKENATSYDISKSKDDYSDFIKATSQLMKDIELIERELLLKTQKNIIKDSPITPSTSPDNKDKTEKPGFYYPLWQAEKESYGRNDSELKNLLKVKADYFKSIDSYYTEDKEEAKRLKEIAESDVVELIQKNNKVLIQKSEYALKNAESVEEYKTSLTDIETKYNTLIAELKSVNASEDIIKNLEEERDARTNKINVKVALTKKMIDRELEQSRIEAELAEVQSQKPDLYNYLNSASEKTIAELELWLEQNSSELGIWTAIETKLREIITKRKKAMSLLDEDIERASNKGGVFGGFLSGIGFQGKSKEKIQIDKINSSRASIGDAEANKHIDEINKSRSKEAGLDIANTSKDLLSSMLDNHEAYLNRRLEQIEIEKQAKLEAIDEESKTEYRSSWWVENQKKKVEEKAEKDKKKVNKQKQKIMIFEAIANQALGITNIWSKWAGLPEVAIPLTAMMLAITGLQIDTIKKSKFGSGGIIKGRRHSQGGVVNEVEEGEAVIKRSSTQGNENFLMALNSMLSGVSVDRMIAQNSAGINRNVANTINNYSGSSSLKKEFDNLSDSIRNIEMKVVLQGQFLSDIDIAKRVENGNKKRRRI